MRKEALVTGGAGFIGSELTRKLRGRYRVTVLDDLSFGRRAHIWPGIRFIRGDLRSPRVLSRALDRVYARVFHLAAIHFIPYCNAHPFESANINIQGTMNVLDAARDVGVGRVFFASTAAVYPIRDEAVDESCETGPMDIYGLSKLAGERLCHEFVLESGIPTIVSRFFNAFGPNETNPHLIPEIQQQVFEILGISGQEAERRFGWFIKALRYGTPPHAGFAMGIDRLLAVLQQEASIRDVIPFPKTQTGIDPMTGSPTPVDAIQLAELGIQLHAGEDADEEEIQQYCRGQIAHFKIPERIRFVAEFPMTVTGKLQKFRMREMEIERNRKAEGAS